MVQIRVGGEMILFDKLDVILAVFGCWLFCDGIISVRLYYNKLAETGGRKQNWRYDHSIRLIRMLIGISLMVIGAL